VGVTAQWNGSDPWQNLYFFYITNGGEFGCARGEHRSARDLVTRRHSDAIVPDGDNTLQLRIDGSDVTFWINGQLVYSVTDPRPLPAGYWGVAVLSDKGNGTVQGKFARITLYGQRAG
jgi:hypothetical protein